MRSWPLVLVALSQPAFANDLSVGVCGDVGIFIRGLTIGTGGVGVYGANGLGGVGGKVIMGTDQGIRVGAEGGYDWDFVRDFNFEVWWAGGYFGVARPIDSNRYAGGSIGIGYGQGNERFYDYHQEYFYFRPRSNVIQDIGPIRADLGIFFQLPIVLKQTLEGRDFDYGWTPWAGVELTISFRMDMGSDRSSRAPAPAPSPVPEPPPPPAPM